MHPSSPYSIVHRMTIDSRAIFLTGDLGLGETSVHMNFKACFQRNRQSLQQFQPSQAAGQ